MKSASGSGPDPATNQSSRDTVEQERNVATIEQRVVKLEKQNRRLKFGMAGLAVLFGYLALGDVLPESVIVQQTLMESKELKLLDNDGQPRLFLRMFSRVPVLQLLDQTGKPRMSLGLRFDDSPFIDLSDKSGRTRATLEMTSDDKPSLQLFDENGVSSFKIQ